MQAVTQKPAIQKYIVKPAQKVYTYAHTFTQRYPVTYLILCALVINFIIEILQRHSFAEACHFFSAHNIVFLYNTLIIFATLSISLLFRKRSFFRVLIMVLWLAMGITDCVILSCRVTPFTATDIAILPSVFSIIQTYFSTFQIVMIVLAICLTIAALAVFCVKSRKDVRIWKKGLVTVVLSWLLLPFITASALHVGAISDEFPNLADAFHEYGFVYCFSNSFIDRGIERPEDYSEDSVDEILEEIQANLSNASAQTPNIVFVQLESFFDVNALSGYTYSENPIPNFTKLAQAHCNGLVTVPSIGAGTANTEFEVISGMNLDYFGTGEYPYKTVLKSTACESINYVLKNYGYTSHAIHNHNGAFYGRSSVFANLGFDTFTSLEYMDDVTFTPRGWAEDRILLDSIREAMESTQSQDLVYTITVQSHGKYPSKYTMPCDITVTNENLDEETLASFTYFINQLHKTDAFIGDLVDMFSDYDEPVILVLFGDHLPSFDISDSDMSSGNTFTTPYVVWSNYGLDTTGFPATLYTYQLYANVLKLLDIEDGVMNLLHQKYSNAVNYQEAMELLQYDMLYGDQTAYTGNIPQSTQMQMGIRTILAEAVFPAADGFYVTGSNFTQWSKVCIDGKVAETVYIEDNLLFVEKMLDRDCTITVEQVGKRGQILSTTNAIAYTVSPAQPPGADTAAPAPQTP